MTENRAQESGGCGAQPDLAAEERLMRSLPEGHLVRLLMAEHEVIRGALDRLEELAAALERGQDRTEVLGEMSALGARLVAAEPHHLREERVLFPRLLERGLTGPPSVMTAEHVEIRRLKHRIEEDARLARERPARQDEDLVAAARSLVAILRAHIVKENAILYPMSLGLIRDPAIWARMKVESDAIGPCPA